MGKLQISSESTVKSNLGSVESYLAGYIKKTLKRELRVLYRSLKFWRYLVVTLYYHRSTLSANKLMHYQVPLGCPSATMRKWVSTSVIYSTNKPETRRDELSKYTNYLHIYYIRVYSCTQYVCASWVWGLVNVYMLIWFSDFDTTGFSDICIIYSSVFSLMAKSKFKVRGRGRCLISTRGFMYMQAADR